MRLLSLFAVSCLLISSALADVDGARQDAASALATIEGSVIYGHKDGLAMTLDVYRPVESTNGAGLIFIVSGGWRSSWRPPEQSLPFYEPFLRAGYTVFAVRHGSSPRYGIPDAYSDVTRAVRFLRSRAADFDVDPERLAVMGNSAGGHLALLLGTRGDDGAISGDALAGTASRVAAVIALVPPTDLSVAVWESPDSLPSYRAFPALDMTMSQAAEYSPVEHASADDAPALIMMGGADELVPPVHGEWMAEALERESVAHRLVVFPEAGHDLGGMANWPQVVSDSIQWLETHLGDQQGGSAMQ
jgi:acetyl esterase/lipase